MVHAVVIRDTMVISANVLLVTKPTGLNVVVRAYASVVYATAWTDGKAMAVSVHLATNFVLLLAAKTYAVDMDIAIVDNADATRQLPTVCIIEERTVNRPRVQVAADFASSTILA